MQTQYDNVVRMDGAIAVEQANKVLRNTYLMLGLTMIPTVIGAYFGMSLNFAFAAEHPFMFAIGMLAVMMGLFFGINATRDSGLGVVLLLVLTGFMGVMLGPILQVALNLRNGAEIVGLAAGGTGAIYNGCVHVSRKKQRCLVGQKTHGFKTQCLQVRGRRGGRTFVCHTAKVACAAHKAGNA